MGSRKRVVAFLSILTTVFIFTVNLGFAGEESVNVLFEKALLADPAE